MRMGRGVPWHGWEAFFNAHSAGMCWRARIKGKEGQTAVVHPLHLITSRPGCNLLMHHVCMMWGHGFEGVLATRDKSLKWELGEGARVLYRCCISTFGYHWG
jgi:hypothetical protein